MRSRSIIRTAVVVSTIAAMCSLGARPAAQQSNYTYTLIADVTECSSMAAPVMNNSAEVAFLGSCGNDWIIRRGDGGVLTTIHSWTSGTVGYVPVHTISINDEGTVAFAARYSQSAEEAILVGNGGAITHVVDTAIHTQFRGIILPVINASGAVAFMADTDDTNGYDSVVVASNGSFVTVAGPGTATDLGALVSAGYPGRLNSSGVVTFLGQAQLTYGVFTGSGGPLTLIASGGSESTINSINTAGRVSFVGLLNNEYAVQSADGTGRTAIATGSDGYLSLHETAINDSGHVVFSAMLQSGQTGIFMGPDPDTDAVVKSGDLLPGLGTITRVWQVSAEALNNAGQVAFGVTYDPGDGSQRHAIVRADPPNRPPVASNATASVTAGGSVSGTLVATDPDGDALTYAIVANGSKGTAEITNTATGAYTYTAATDTSGDDTFTFQATDSHGASSNVATVTVAIQPPPTCAVDVTSSILQLNTKGSKRSGTTQSITLENVSSSAITGPVSLALDSLTEGVRLANAAGVTSCAPPAGSPYVDVNVGSDGIWSPGERVEVVLQFTREGSGRGKKPAITYTLRVLAGAGAR